MWQPAEGSLQNCFLYVAQNIFNVFSLVSDSFIQDLKNKFSHMLH